MRWLVGAELVIAMLAFGLGVYHAAEYLKGGRPVVHRPNEVSVTPLPGTLYVVQQGAIYRFHHGNFTQVTPESGWLQPAADPRGGQLIAVQRQADYSDLYLITTGGRAVSQLTHNSSGQVEGNHWSFYPRFSSDGASIFYDYDPKDPYNNYHVDLSIFASPSDPSSRSSVRWTYANNYSGGDVYPVPLRDRGGLVYVRYSIDDQFKVHSQVWLQTRPGTAGEALTPPDADCAQPALSPDETRIAMVCTKGSNTTAELDVAAFDPANPTLGSLSTLVSGGLVASPAFSPDGMTLAYLAPTTTGGAFQLWTAAASGPPAPKEITSDLGLDATSPPVWLKA
jgi:Tol biopolymer transport system component